MTEEQMEYLEGPITKYMEQRDLDGFQVDIWNVGSTPDSMARVAIHVGKQKAWLVVIDEDGDDAVEEEVDLKWNAGMVNTFGVEKEIKRQLILARIQMDHLLVAEIAKLRAFALAHYNEGGDGVVECWEDSDLAHHYWQDPKTAKVRLLEIFDMSEEHRREIMATIF